jgi:hypothetical protein
MATYGRNKVEELLEQGRVGLGNALGTPEILSLLTPYGYGQAKLQEGQVLFHALEGQQAAQLRLYAQQKETTASFQTSWGAARKIYGRHGKIARAVLSAQPERLARLGLEGVRAQTFGPWLAQARQFYREALADAGLQAVLAEGGLSPAVLTAGQSIVESAVQADNAKESAKGLAQQSTQDRDAAAATFQDWLRRFWKIAEVALAGQPQWLERLGRKVRS